MNSEEYILVTLKDISEQIFNGKYYCHPIFFLIPYVTWPFPWLTLKSYISWCCCYKWGGKNLKKKTTLSHLSDFSSPQSISALFKMANALAFALTCQKKSALPLALTFWKNELAPARALWQRSGALFSALFVILANIFLNSN